MAITVTIGTPVVNISGGEKCTPSISVEAVYSVDGKELERATYSTTATAIDAKAAAEVAKNLSEQALLRIPHLARKIELEAEMAKLQTAIQSNLDIKLGVKA